MSDSEDRSCTLLLSGGIDSALTAHLLLSQGWNVRALWIDFGQPAAKAEATASRQVAQHYSLSLDHLVVEGLRVKREGEVQGRNDLLVAVAAITAPDASVAIGVHSGTEYSDCSPPWAAAWQQLLDVQHQGTVQLVAPLLDLTKGDIFGLCRDLKVPVELTYSCERGDTPCGECLSCADRGAWVAGS